MDYYNGKVIKTFKRIFTTFTPFSSVSKVGTAEQFIYIVRETPKMLYGYGYNGRWKYDKVKNEWLNYEQYRWLVMNGTFIEIEEKEAL